MQKTITFLMFVGDQCGKAEEAINFYTSLFENSEIKNIEKYSRRNLAKKLSELLNSKL